MGLLVANRVGILGGAGDLLLGGGCALLVAGLVGRPAPPSPPRTGRGQGEVSNPSTTRSFALYARLAAGVSEFSYTLYLVHFPILAFLFYSVFKGKQMQPGLHSAFWFVGILTAVLIYAALIWYCFERNTDRLRKRIEPFLFGGGASVPASR
jgi:peptidoglycan/LPS O-acetylase OafA/YrhL